MNKEVHGVNGNLEANVGLSALPVMRAGASETRQNWILDPVQDTLFVISAPLLALAAALFTFKTLGGAAATSLIIATHIVFTVAHHLPTFIRVYGDVDLFRRFKWNFLLAPVVPLTICIGVLGYIHYKSYPVEYFLYLYLMLALWDPWHFLRQHYGFMRIYDRHNAAPRRIAARMDLALCVAWFAFIMLASGAWLIGILQDLYNSAQLPLVLAVSAGAVSLLTEVARNIALVMTVSYGVYLVWCRHKGYFISGAKLALFATTFGVMYVAYTPNDWILSIAPGWTFQVGFAAVGIVHMTQYLAIVWRYNRNLAAQPERARQGWFHRLHARGGWVIGAGYVALCLFYGEFVTTRHANQALMSVLLAIGFTSTLLHYYFDGFIWKVRHAQNRQNLMPDQGTQVEAVSWWHSFRAVPPRTMLLRQSLYFGVPMLILTFGAVSVWSAAPASYIEYMYRAQVLSQQGDAAGARAAAESARVAMQRQLPLAQRMAELQPTSAREAELAFLIYNDSYYERVVLPSIDGRILDANTAALHGKAVVAAADVLEHAIGRGSSVAHGGRDRMTREDALRTLASWRKQIAESEL